MTHPQPGYVAELDGLRGGACLAVLFAHCLFGLFALPEGLAAHINSMLVQLLLSGVDLFFVLSGFLIGGILLDNRGETGFFKVFWVRRIARIFPANYLLLGSYVLAVWVRHHANVPQLDVVLPDVPSPQLWTYATFTQNFAMSYGGYQGPRWLVVTWSLAIEEQFYVLFSSAVFLLLSRRSLVAMVVAAIAIAPMLRGFAEWYYGWRPAYFLLPCRMDALMFGVLVAMIVRHPPAMTLIERIRPYLDGLTVLLVLLLIGTIAPAFALNWWPMKRSLLALLFALMVLRVFSRDGGLLNWALRTPILVKAATISYGLYMYHEVVNLLAHGLLLHQLPKIDSTVEAILSVLVMTAAVGLSIISYLGVERPIRRFARKAHFGGPSTADSSVAGSV